MANPTEITLWTGEATPADIVLRPLSPADAPADSVCYLYPLLAPVPPACAASDIVLRTPDVTPADIAIQPLQACTPGRGDAIIVLRPLLVLDGYVPPAVTYYGILRRWTGAAWAKAKLMAEVGGVWVAKPLRRWDGAAWLLVDATGV